MAKKAVDIHEAFASYLAFENCVLWDAYTPRQFSLFKQKLNELYRDAGSSGSERNKAMEKVRAKIYNSSIAQAKYTNKNLLSTFILVTVAEGEDFFDARNASKFSVHLIVRTRKCMKNNDSSKCCMIFIDEHGRVYQNWNAFIEDNLLPEGVAFAPSRGCYSYEGGKLCMESWMTPASKLGTKLVASTDAAACVGAFTAAGITIATLAIPVAAPLLAVASFLGVSTGVYTAVRSGLQLKERKDHEQSIALTDKQARGCWLGVTTGALAVSSTVANKALASVVLAGREVTLVEQTMINGINITTMLLSGTGVAKGVVDIIIKISDDEEITSSDWLQVAASLAIFTHSVYNFRTASTIMSNSRSSKAFSLKNKLIAKLKKTFQKITSTTTSTSGKADLIRLTNEIPDNVIQINNAISLVNNCYKLINGLVLDKDSLNSCVRILVKYVGSELTEFLMKKAIEFLGMYKDTIESFIKRTLFYETALWDLYKKCEEKLTKITIYTLEENIQIIFHLLLEQYKQMAWRDPKQNVIQCNICNGFYSVCQE